MLEDLGSIRDAWALVLRMYTWMSSHTILAGVTFMDLLIWGVAFEVILWAIGKLLPGLSGSENQGDFSDNPFNIRSSDDMPFSYGDTYDDIGNWERF